MVLATLVAVGLFGWGERERYLREHVFVRVVDESTGIQLDAFRFRTWIITEQSGLEPIWTDWIVQRGDTPLTLKVPQNCRLFVEAHEVGNPMEDGVPYDSMLVAPDATHQLTVRVKTGFSNVIPDNEFVDSKSAFVNGPYVLSGRVIGEDSKPITEFGIRIFLQYALDESYFFEIQESEGRFNIGCPTPISRYIVESDQLALEQQGLSEDKDSSLEETANLTIRLKSGFRISGTVQMQKAHRKKSTVFLMDRRTEKFVFDCDFPTLSDPRSESPNRFASFGHSYQHEVQPDQNGNYEFAHIQSGKYFLVVLYNDQLVVSKPISVRSENLELLPIVVPPTGSIHGVVKEWQSWSPVPETSLFASSTINPYEIYQLSHRQMNSRKLFRVDHLGRFSLDDVLVGQGVISLFPPPFRSHNHVIVSPFQVVAGKSTEVGSDYIPILDLDISSEDQWIHNQWDSQSLSAELIGSNGFSSIAWLGKPELNRNGARRRLYGAGNLPSGQFKMRLVYDYHGSELHTQFEYQKNTKPQVKEFSSHELSIGSEPFLLEKIQWMRCSICKDGAIVSEPSFAANETKHCIVEGSGRFEVLLEHSEHGWAVYHDVSFSRSKVELGDLTWSRGGTIEIDISLMELPLGPERFELRHELTGRCHAGGYGDHSWILEKTFYEDLMPGTWVYELFGSDPIEGEKRLLTKRFELSAGETILYDGH